VRAGIFCFKYESMETKTKKQELVKKIAIQGGFGAFHDMAAHQYFHDEDFELVTCETFNDQFKILNGGKADYGIMAIENSVAGSILPNYALLSESNMKIVGEIYLRVEQNLVALPGQTIDDIKEVYSHPMAILQCQKFFDNYPDIKLIKSIDTALSAKEIRIKNLKGVGAIASSLAAERYQLQILEAGIETTKNNYTRFLILIDKDKEFEFKNPIDKASIYFSLADEIGELSKVLSIFSFYNLNLSKIQSLPIIGKEWEYLFYVDLEFRDYKIYRQALTAIEPLISDLGILGEFPKGEKYL
jgi:prephenate dehydratase